MEMDNLRIFPLISAFQIQKIPINTKMHSLYQDIRYMNNVIFFIMIKIFNYSKINLYRNMVKKEIKITPQYNQPEITDFSVPNTKL